MNPNSETSGVTSESAAVTAATGAVERVCLSVVPVKVLAKGSNLIPVETCIVGQWLRSDSLP